MDTFNFPPYANSADADAVRPMLRAALAKGWSVSVYDGEETTVHKSRDSAIISAAMMTTDLDVLSFYDYQGKGLGSMWLVWGNSGDVWMDASTDHGGTFDQFTDRFMI